MIEIFRFDERFDLTRVGFVTNCVTMSSFYGKPNCRLHDEGWEAIREDDNVKTLVDDTGEERAR